MTDDDRYDDSDCGKAAQRAERVTRWGWTAIASVVGLLAMVLLGVVVLLLVVVFGIGYLYVN
ncbi:hypothetical protein ACFXPY_42240 [Streptomyces sp. NPDC059153]|uniref:hypothetical protein n=1 Tax=Streptomyces sp. NPDC059153 TaxID=3346743 RepID=UPI00368434F0